MNLTIKPLLIFLFSLGWIMPMQSQTVLRKENHLFREGDVILKQELQYKPPGRSGQNVIWDFSSLLPLGNEYRESYSKSDNLLTCSGVNAAYEYCLSGDSLLCTGYSNQLLQINYLLPDLCMHYPTVYSDSVRSIYYGEGKYSHTLNVVNYGESIRRADAEGILLLPDGEILSRVLRVHESVRTGQRMSSSPAILSLGYALSYSTDSLLYRLSHDSVTWQVDTYRWYAPGYRYPVFETVQTFVCALGTPVRHFCRSYFYPSVEQKYLTEDQVNMIIREEIDMQSDKDGNNDPIQNLELLESLKNYAYNSYMTADENLLKVEILLKEPCVVELLLCSMSGYYLDRKKVSDKPIGMHCEAFNIASLPTGNYLLSVIINGEVNSEKIQKK